jgi:uncharacterized protein YkwD
MFVKLSQSLLLLAAFTVSQSSDSLVLAQQANVVCPKCGKIHAATASPVVQASATLQSGTPSSPSTIEQASGQGVSNVLSTLNSQRARQGVGQLSFDPELQAVAERRAAAMARSGNKSHPPGSFAPGRYEGVGWSSSYSPSGVSACFTSDSRMRAAGAAMATGRDGVYFAVVYR